MGQYGYVAIHQLCSRLHAHILQSQSYNKNDILNYKRPGQLQEFPGWMSTGGIS